MKLNGPGVASVIEQLPAPPASVTGQVWEPPSLTVTVPVGVPPPGGLAATLTFTEIGSPATNVDAMLVIAVVVASCPTVTGTPAAVTEGAKPDVPA